MQAPVRPFMGDHRIRQLAEVAPQAPAPAESDDSGSEDDYVVMTESMDQPGVALYGGNEAFPHALPPGDGQAVYVSDTDESEYAEMDLQRQRDLQRVWHSICIDAVVMIAFRIAEAVILAISWHKPCDSDLKEWVIGHGILITLAVVMGDYSKYLRVVNPARLRAMLPFFRILSLGSLAWFVRGNVELMSADTCRSTAPHLYNYSLLSICLIYVEIGLHVVLVCMVVYVRSRQGRRNVPSEAQVKVALDNLETTTYSRETTTLALEDATCVICMGEYEDNDVLAHLPCKHHMHKTCLGDWLKVNMVCPMCRAAVGPGGADNGNISDTDSDSSDEGEQGQQDQAHDGETSSVRGSEENV